MFDLSKIKNKLEQQQQKSIDFYLIKILIHVLTFNTGFIQIIALSFS
jgi:hypothetical protein